MRNIFFPVIKISIYKAEDKDIVFIFSGVKVPTGDYLQMQIACPIGEGEKWVYSQFKTHDYEVVQDGFSVCAPV
jgi:hypothetical protein